MNFVFRKDSGKSPKNSLKVAFCACKWKFGSTTVHCSNSVMHELWTLSCASNERREAYLSIHVHLIKQIYDYDSKKLQWNSVSFILGRTVHHLENSRIWLVEIGGLETNFWLIVLYAPAQYAIFAHNDLQCRAEQCALYWLQCNSLWRNNGAEHW